MAERRWQRRVTIATGMLLCLAAGLMAGEEIIGLIVLPSIADKVFYPLAALVIGMIFLGEWLDL